MNTIDMVALARVTGGSLSQPNQTIARPPGTIFNPRPDFPRPELPPTFPRPLPLPRPEPLPHFNPKFPPGSLDLPRRTDLA